MDDSNGFYPAWFDQNKVRKKLTSLTLAYGKILEIDRTGFLTTVYQTRGLLREHANISELEWFTLIKSCLHRLRAYANSAGAVELARCARALEQHYIQGSDGTPFSTLVSATLQECDRTYIGLIDCGASMRGTLLSERVGWRGEP